MKFLVGFAAGVCLVLVLGAAVQRYHVTVVGEFEKVGVYQPALSGVSEGGECYLAVTNTRTGRTELFGITGQTQKKLTDQPFQLSGRAVRLLRCSDGRGCASGGDAV